MSKSRTVMATALALSMPMGVWASPIPLSPAEPQPNAQALEQGLAVMYAYPSDVDNIASARSAVEKWGKPGPSLAGLSYDDTTEGDITLTAKQAMIVAAGISGFIKFDAPGTYVVDFLNNDGLELSIGGQQVADYDGIHACGYAGEIEVDVPKDGFYALEKI